MKIALLSDIHGNSLALKAVLDSVKKHGAERLLIAGDLVGYYFWPKDVLELLAQWDLTLVCGNHEVMLDKIRKNSESIINVNNKYGTGLQLATEQLGASQLEMLCSLPHSVELNINECKILLCHGAPWDVNQYVYSNSEIDVLRRCAIPTFDFIVMGHTHYPMNVKIGRTLLINPGSVGQPRNYRPGAYWALLNTDSCEVNQYCEPYNADLLISESRRRHPDIPYLAEVLERI